jgi:hypothetical protein
VDRITTEDGAGIENDELRRLKGITLNEKAIDRNSKLTDVRLTPSSKEAVRQNSLQ